MIQPAIETSESLLEFIHKRLRNQRKRLTKIEKYENLDKEKLNSDQVETIARKAEVLSTIKELEECLSKATVEEDLHREDIEKIRLEGDQNCLVQVRNAVNQTLSLQQQAIHHIHRVNYAMSLPLTVLIGKHSVTQIEFNALLALKGRLDPASKSVDEYLLEAEKYHAMLFNGAADYVQGTELTFAELNALVIRLLLPLPPAPKFGMVEASPETLQLENETENKEVKDPKKKKYKKKSFIKKNVGGMTLSLQSKDDK